MDIQIVEQKDNPLFGRKEVTFRVTHAGETTPSRVQVRQLVAAEIGTKTDNVVIAKMASDYGRGATTGQARAYKSSEEARKSERVHFLKRNSLYVEKAKKGEKKAEGEKGAKPAAAPTPAAPAAKPAEKKAEAKPAEKKAEAPAKPAEKKAGA